jgi:hypothetical protein
VGDRLLIGLTGRASESSRRRLRPGGKDRAVEEWLGRKRNGSGGRGGLLWAEVRARWRFGLVGLRAKAGERSERGVSGRPPLGAVGRSSLHCRRKNRAMLLRNRLGAQMKARGRKGGYRSEKVEWRSVVLCPSSEAVRLGRAGSSPRRARPDAAAGRRSPDPAPILGQLPAQRASLPLQVTVPLHCLR